MPLTAVARAVARAVGGRTVLTTLRSAVPLSLRETAEGLTVLASAFTPLGGDDTRLEVAVERGARLRVGSAAAQVAQPGVHSAVSHASVALQVEGDASLHWQPQPLVVVAGAEHRFDLTADIAGTGTAVLVDTVVLGRAGGAGGRYRSRWRIVHGGEPLLTADLDVGAGAAPGWDGPAVCGGARVLVTVLVAGGPLPPEDALVDGGEVMRLAGEGVLFSWIGADTVAAGRAITSFLSLVPSVQPHGSRLSRREPGLTSGARPSPLDVPAR